MSWATPHIEKLGRGETVRFRPRGNSMKGKIESGQLVTVEPLRGRDPQVGDIVLCRVSGSHYLHLVKAKRSDQYQIGNNRGGLNGWIGRGSVFGILVDVEP